MTKQLTTSPDVSGTGASSYHASPKELRRIQFSSFLGTAIEYYDFILYATAAGIVFNRVFFVGLDQHVALILSFATLAAGYAARPLGGLIFGHLGDRLGRKNVIVGGWLIAGIAFTAMMMGPNNPGFVLPMYMIGLFFLLGPYAAIMYFQAECFQPECRGTGSAFIVSMSQPGAVVGGFILTALVTANFGLTNATIIIALGGVLLSGLIMMFARPVKPSPEPENVGLSKLKNASLAPRV